MTAIADTDLYQTIHRQPSDWRRLLQGADGWDAAAERLRAARHVLLVGTGTSYHAAQVGANLLRAAGRLAWAEQSHDFAAYPFPLGADDAVVVISHTGWKGESLRAVQRARELGAWCLAINGQDSKLSGPDAALVTVPQETSATYTASYTAALVVLAGLAVRLGASALEAPLIRLPEQAAELLGREHQLRDWVQGIDLSTRFAYAGGGINGWTGTEGALKAMEASYVTAEGMSLEELLHGPFVGLDTGDHLVLINVPGPFEGRAADMASAAVEVGLDVYWIGSPPSRPGGLPGFQLSTTEEMLSPLLTTLPVQLIACYLAERRGTNPDRFHMDDPRFDRALTALQF